MHPFTPQFCLYSNLDSLIKAADLGVPLAQWQLALRYLNGNDVTRNTKKAADLLKMAVRNGSSLAMRDLAKLKASENKTKSTRALLERAAKQGNVKCQLELGLMLLKSVDRDGHAIQSEVELGLYYLQLAGMNSDNTALMHYWFYQAVGAPMLNSQAENLLLLQRLGNSGNGKAHMAMAFAILCDYWPSDIKYEASRSHLQHALELGVLEADLQLVDFDMKFGNRTNEHSTNSVNIINRLMSLATEGNSLAQAVLGLTFIDGFFASKSIPFGIKIISEIDDNEIPIVIFAKGIAAFKQFEISGEARFAVDAHKFLERAFKSGYSKARDFLSELYRQPRVLEILKIDAFVAEKFTEQCAASGCKECTVFLAVDYQYRLEQKIDSGEINEKNRHKLMDKMLFYLESLAADLETSAMNELGTMFRDGKLVPRDLTRAISYFSSSAYLKNSFGIENLCMLYAKQKGLLVTPQFIASVLEFGARSGCPSSQFELSVRYYNGIGLVQDLMIANYWQQKSFETWEKMAVESGTSYTNIFASKDGEHFDSNLELENSTGNMTSDTCTSQIEGRETTIAGEKKITTLFPRNQKKRECKVLRLLPVAGN